MKIKIFLISILVLMAFSLTELKAQTVLGKWKTKNDEGRVNSIIEIYKEGDQVFGKVVRITKEEDRDRVCTRCDGELKDQPIEGLVLMRGFEKEGEKYVDGTITDPKTGKEYDSKIWLSEDDPDKLMVRGYIAFFYKTKVWERLK